MSRLRLTRLETRAVPALATWDGGGANANWTTATNWVGDVTPQPGDDLVFPAGVTNKTATNDFADGTAFNSLAINEAGYTIGGNAVALTAGVSANVIFANNQFDSTLALPINGTGGLTSTNGNLILAAANGYTGVTTVTGGSVTLRTATALGAAGAGNGTTLLGAAVFLDADGLTVSEAFTAFNGPADQTPVFALNGVRRTGTFAGPITLGADASIGANGVFSMLVVAGGITQTVGPRNLVVQGVAFAAGTTVAVTGTTTVNGDVVFDATGPTGPVRVATGNISGSGTVGAIAPAGPDNNYFLSPGPQVGGSTGPGMLMTAGLTAFTAATLFVFDLGATTDRIVVNGPVQLAGRLNVRPDFGFAPTLGQRVRLIDNDGTDAIQGTFVDVPEGAIVGLANGFALRATYRGGDGNDFEVVAVTVASTRRFAVGAGAGGLPLVNVYDGAGALVRSFLAYDASFRGGVNVATADFNGDNVPDIVTAPGFGGGPVLRIWDGTTGAMIRQFLAYDEAFRGGVNVATGFVNAGNVPDIITGPGVGGGPVVRAFDVSFDPALIVQFLAYDANFRGGVRVAGGEATLAVGQSPPQAGFIVTAAGPGGGPHVRTFNSLTGAANGPGFFAYDAAFTGGVNVAYAAGRIVTAPDAGGGPVVRGFTPDGALQFQYLAYDGSFRGGVRVAARSLGDDFSDRIITGPGAGGGPVVRVWNVTGTTLERQFNAFDPAFQGGVFVG